MSPVHPHDGYFSSLCIIGVNWKGLIDSGRNLNLHVTGKYGDGEKVGIKEKSRVILWSPRHVTYKKYESIVFNL